MPTLYEESIPVILHYFGNLKAIIKKGEDYATQGASTEGHPTKETLLNHHLYHDMKGLAFQVQACSNVTKALISRCAGGENTVMEDDETTFEQLYERIDRTVEILKTIDVEAYNKDWDKELIMKTNAMGDYHFASKQVYVSQWVLSNFFFHVSIAYCILRNAGVPVGGLDFLAGVAYKVERS